MKEFLIFPLTICCVVLTLSGPGLGQDKGIGTPTSVAGETSDRNQDGLNGPVRRIRVETSKISVKDGNFVEGPRVLREVATYDPKGRKIDSVAHPVEGSTLPGKEEYRYDDNGNIVEMVLRGDDGSILSKETYKYELDEIGNWKRMTSSVAIYENGKVTYEPIEVTYRTISYYYGQAVDKLVSSGLKHDAKSPKTSPAPAAAIIPPVTAVTIPLTTPSEVAPTASKVSTSGSNVPISKEPPIENINSRQMDDRAKDSRAAGSSPNLKAEGESKPEVLSAANAAAGPKVPGKAADAPPDKVSVSSVPEKELHDAAVNSPDSEISKAAGSARTDSKIEVPGSAPENPKNKNVEEPTSPVSSTPTTVTAPSEVSGGADSATTLYEKGLTHLAANRYAEAVKALSESIRLNPNDAQAYLKLGIAHLSQGQYKETVAVLKMAIQIKPAMVDAQGYYNLGRAYAALGKHSNALQSFKQALYVTRAEAVDQPQVKEQNSPPLAYLHHGIGAMYYNLQRYKDAIQEMKRAIELNPKLADAHYVLALSYIAVGNRSSAEAEQKTLQSLDATLAKKIAADLSKPNAGLHCRTVFGPCN